MRPGPVLLCLPALVSSAPAEGIKPGRLTDAQTEAVARAALTSQDAAEQRKALTSLQVHHFASTRAREREFVLYAQGLLEDRLGDTSKAAVTLRKLEHTWPQSPYLPEIETILATEAVEHKRYKEAESRLKRALLADIPVENKRRAQELLLWTLAEQGHQAEGMPIVKTLQPLGSGKPSEKGFVGMMEALALAKEKDQAEAVRKDFHTFYPTSPYGPRVDLAWARMLGTTGDVKGSAETFRAIITDKPNAPEADEARLALATLLSEGKLPPKEAEAFPTPQKLLSELHKADRKGNSARRALLVELRLDMNEAKWKEAVDTATQLRGLNPTPDEAAAATQFREDAFKSWTQQLLDGPQIGPVLPYLDAEGIQCLSPEQRLALVKRLAQVGLPEAARTLIDLAPSKEQPALRKATLEATSAEARPEEALGLMPVKGESPLESLRRAQALVTLRRWNDLKGVLGRAKPGPERTAALMSYLHRPAEKGEGPSSRLKEAEAWLARAPERGADREPLAILVADLRTQAGDWRGALALYPAAPQSANQGWVALMRATCQLKLHQRAAAQATLKAAEDQPGFKMERQTLGRQLEK